MTTNDLILGLSLLVMVGPIACGIRRPAGRTDWRVANIHRVLIVSLGFDRKEDARIESEAAPVLRRQGFDAVDAHAFFVPNASYSPVDLFETLQRASIDGVMEVLPRGASGFVFKYYRIKGQTKPASAPRGSLEDAFGGLLKGSGRP